MSDEGDDDLFSIFASVPPGPTSPTMQVDRTGIAPSQSAGFYSQSKKTDHAGALNKPAKPSQGMSLLKPTSSDGDVSTHVPSAAGAVMEAHSKIVVTRPTDAFQQLSVVLAQYPYSHYDRFFASPSTSNSASSSTPTNVSLIGVVVRKSEPKTKGVGQFGVLTLWDMTGFCDISTSTVPGLGGASSNIAALLVGGAAFSELYIRLGVGDVVVAAHPDLLPPRPASSSSLPSSPMAKVSDYHQLRLLGYSKSLGQCGATLSSGYGVGQETCRNMVNKDSVKFCRFHSSSLRREALGKGESQTARTIQSAGTGSSSHATVQRPFLSSAKAQLGGSQSSCAGAIRTSSSAGSSQFIAVRRGAVVDASGRSIEGSSNRGPTMEYAGVTRVRGSLQETGLNSAAESSFPTPAALGTTAMGHRALKRVIEDTHQLEVEREIRAAMTVSVASACGATGKKPITTPAGKIVVPATASLLTHSAITNCGVALAARRDDVKRGRSPPADCRSSSDWESEAKRLRAEAATAPPTFAPLQGRPDARLADVVVRNKLATMGTKVGVSTNSFAAKMALTLDLSVTKAATTSQQAKSASGVNVSRSGQGSFTVLGRVADGLSSRHDDARLEALEATSRSLDAKALAQDAAYRALDSITEEPTKGYFCAVCRLWGFSKQKKCHDAGHNGFVGDTVKAYFACKECGTKAPVLGTGHGALVPMFCPRCRTNTVFERSTAAPKIPEPYAPRLP